MSRKKDKGLNIPLWLIVVLVIVIFTPIGGALKNVVTGETNLWDLIWGKGEEEVEYYYGSCSFKINQQDYLAGGAASPTGAKYLLFHTKPVKGATFSSITAGGTTTDIRKADKGYVWYTIYGGSDFFIVEEAFIAGNSRIVDDYWEDYDEDGDDDFIIKVYVGDVGERGQGLTPVCALDLPLLQLDLTLTNDNPDDQTGLEETEKVVQIEWELSGITEEYGCYLTELYFVTNDTRKGNDVKLEEVTLSGGWVRTSGAPTEFDVPCKEENGDYEAWYYKADDNREYNQGIRMWRDTGEPDTLHVTLNVRITFEENDAIGIHLYATFIGPDGTDAQVDDEVGLGEA